MLLLTSLSRGELTAILLSSVLIQYIAALICLIRMIYLGLPFKLTVKWNFLILFIPIGGIIAYLVRAKHLKQVATDYQESEKLLAEEKKAAAKITAPQVTSTVTNTAETANSKVFDENITEDFQI